jgi:hypothetical protein
VNGNEHFYYRGDTQALNDMLKKFANIEAHVREVILLPGPGITTSFNEVKRVPYDWSLHIAGGLSRSYASKEKRSNTNVWDKYPTTRVLVGGSVNLEKIRIPEGVIVTELADLRRRYLKGLQSDDREIRAWAASFLAQVDFHNKENVAPIAKLLEEKDDWVRLMAAGALAKFGKNAESALPMLRQGLQDDKERVKKRFQETIERVQSAEDTKAAAKEHRTMLAKITQFVKSLPKDSPK